MACPAVSVALPIDVAPASNVTVPVGVPVMGDTALTVAVKIMACPKTEGFTDEVRLVLELVLTVWVRTAEVLEMKLPSPS